MSTLREEWRKYKKGVNDRKLTISSPEWEEDWWITTLKERIEAERKKEASKGHEARWDVLFAFDTITRLLD